MSSLNKREGHIISRSGPSLHLGISEARWSSGSGIPLEICIKFTA